MKLFAFSKSHRIRTTAEFRITLDRGSKAVREEIVVFVLPTVTEPSRSRLGLIVSRKVGKAHERNLVKRRLREIFRAQIRPQLRVGADIVVIARERARRVDFADLSHSFAAGVGKAIARLQPKREPGVVA